MQEKLFDRDKVHYYLSMMLAFVLPIYQKLVPVILVLITINWLLLGKRILQSSNHKRYWSFLPIMAYYIWHIVGLIWSENLDFGLFDLQIKLPLLLLPVIYSSFKFFNQKEFDKILWSFIYGCLAAILVGIINSFYIYFSGESLILSFYEANITPVLHIGYFAMYLNLGLLLCIYMIIKSETQIYSVRNAGLILSAMVIIMATFLSTARNGFLVMVMILLLLGVYAIVKYRKWMLALMAMLLIWIGASTMLRDIGVKESDMHGFDRVLLLMESKGEVTAQAWESTAVRVLIWKSVKEIVLANPILGSGTGDIKNELVKIYKRENYIYIIDKQLNAHNQFLQSWGALGVLGLLLSILCFALPLYIAIKSFNFVLGFFILSVGASCLSESVLEVQAGVVFFSFFLTLFIIGDKNDAFIDLQNVKLNSKA